MKRKILQSIANKIIDNLSKSEGELFDFYYEIGLWFDSVAINVFNEYLD